MVLFSPKNTKKLIYWQNKKFTLQINKNSRQITHGFSIKLIVLYLQQFSSYLLLMHQEKEAKTEPTLNINIWVDSHFLDWDSVSFALWLKSRQYRVFWSMQPILLEKKKKHFFWFDCWTCHTYSSIELCTGHEFILYR
jgi:hypothetical protein